MRSENIFSFNSAASFLCMPGLLRGKGWGRGLGFAEMLTIRIPLLCHTFASVSFKTVVSFFMFFLRPPFFTEKRDTSWVIVLSLSMQQFGLISISPSLYHTLLLPCDYYQAFFPFTLGKGISSQLERKSWQLAHILRLQQGGQRPKSTRI